MNYCGWVPIKLYFWILKYEFHFMCHDILFLFCPPPQSFKNVKTILSLQRIQAAKRWWEDLAHGLLFAGVWNICNQTQVDQ